VRFYERLGFRVEAEVAFPTDGRTAECFGHLKGKKMGRAREGGIQNWFMVWRHKPYHTQGLAVDAESSECGEGAAARAAELRAERCRRGMRQGFFRALALIVGAGLLCAVARGLHWAADGARLLVAAGIDA
jgi:hypothetical protein